MFICPFILPSKNPSVVGLALGIEESAEKYTQPFPQGIGSLEELMVPTTQ